MHCPYCGFKVEDGFLYCPKCGKLLDNSNTHREVNNYNSSYEVPVTNSQEPAAPTYEDNFSKTKNILDQNGIAYKAYSNETGHCIIIEL